MPALIYGDTKDGLFGIPVSADDSDIALIDSAFKILTSPDNFVSETAWEDFRVTNSKRQTSPASFSDMANYLSNVDTEFPVTDYKSLWSSAREVSGRLNILWNLSDSAPSICVGEDIITNRKHIFKSIRAYLRKLRTENLKSKVRQGRTLSCFAADKASSHFHRTGDYLRFTDWRWIHMARLRLQGPQTKWL